MNFYSTEEDLNNQYITGIMTANGTVTLDFTPRAVFVYATIVSTTNPYCSFAFAIQNNPQDKRYDGSGTKYLKIETESFITNGMKTDGNTDPSATFPLRYIAFK